MSWVASTTGVRAHRVLILIALAACATAGTEPDIARDSAPDPDPQMDASQGCPVGELACAGDCVDPQADEAFCGASGDCTGGNAGEQCALGASCVQGACVCPGSQQPCEGSCTDLNVDPANCGACGVVCGAGETCTSGSCVGPALVYEESFTQAVNSNAQCTSYTSFLAQLESGYSTVQVSGSRNPTGYTCSDPALVAIIAEGLKNGTQFHVTCGGVDWQNCVRSYGPEFWVRPNTPVCDPANCPADGAMVRPCITIGTGFWGGIENGTSSCQGPNQTMRVEFE